MSSPDNGPGADVEFKDSSRGRSVTSRLLQESPLDVLVIGGGIVGAGIVRDAALRGLRAGLVEQIDFAFGTSSRSSRLLHGGMRYLAQGRLGLVRESSLEKKTLHHIAPHLAAPLPFIFPAYRGGRDWVLWQLKAGVKIYDLLCGGQNLGKSTWLKPNETLQKVPALRAEDLQGAVRYFDGFTNDARLVLDTLRSAERAGAIVLNYCRFKKAEKRQLWECEAEDRISGTCLGLSAHTVVNATGPWTEGVPHSRMKLRLTKGAHLVIQRSRLPVSETVVMTEGKRILFAIPWGERVILGTTDTDYQGSLDRVFAEKEEIRYLIEVANRHFPTTNLAASDVISTWAGLRPLIANASGNPSDISRSHKIHNPEPGWWDVAGGKLTTYRRMAEQTVDRLIREIKVPGRKIGPCRSASELLLPESETTGISGILPPECSRRVVEHFCKNEWVVHLEDVMLRRTSWHQYFPEAAAIANLSANWMAELLGWSKEKRDEEIERYDRATHVPGLAPSQPQPEPASA